MSLITHEIRWFCREQPLEVADVFGHIPSVRTDWYAPPGNVHTGTKIREGRLETKLMTAASCILARDGCEGTLEQWEKWSANLEGMLPTETQLRNAGWIAVHKRRWMQVWDTESTPPRTSKDRIGRGALFEVTELHALKQNWWTIGFESFGSDESREASLMAVMDHVLSHLPLNVKLSVAGSEGYPGWLRSL